MPQSLGDRYKKWAKRRTSLRLYQFITISLILALLIFLPLSNPAPSENFRADNWAQMSISVGASVLTLLAVIVAIGLSSENNRRLEFNECLTGILNKIEEKKRNNPDRSFDNAYDNSKEKIQEVIDSVPILRYTESLIGILSFIFFLFSAVSAVIGYPFTYTVGSFAYGIVLLTGYVLYVIEEFANMDKFSRVRKKKGSLSLLDIKINGVHKKFEIQNKEVILSLPQKIEKIELKVRFEGYARNGFLHASVKYKNNLVSYIPDSNTFLASYGFIDDYHLTLLEKEFDTGILQVEKSTDSTFEIILRSNKGTDENPLIGTGFIERLGIKEIYKHCSLTANFQISSIELRIYEDPLYKPNFKRREIDCITLKITEPEPRI